ncbi:MAG: 16S rRNA (guanine(966)-N(2))-methyltransferase RsmD [Bacteroidales bacterium]|nr:16S rRNA (guanine(966)-N(2))-methyltransferase RsmD [Bacteroidales bacterium]
MRIIGGQYRGKQIPSDNRLTLRPTTDFAKEGLFNILSNRYDFENLDVLDLFAGTGSISYEFASRDARNIHSIEIDPQHVSFIRSVIKKIGLQQIRVVRDDVFHFLNICKEQYDIIFADPPYDMEKIIEIPDLILNKNILNPEGILILEHSRRTDFSSHPNLIDHRNYGNVHFSFFR